MGCEKSLFSPTFRAEQADEYASIHFFLSHDIVGEVLSRLEVSIDSNRRGTFSNTQKRVPGAVGFSFFNSLGGSKSYIL